MAKFGIGVGEEFPVDDAAPRNPPPPESGDTAPERRRHGRGHHVLHVLTRIAFVALIVSLVAWMFRPHFYRGFYDYDFHPAHHFFHFPFFPLLLLFFVLAFAFRRGCYGMHRHWHHGHWHHRHWHWHDAGHRDRGEGA